MGSETFKLNLEDLKKIGKGLLIAMGGAGLTYLSVQVVPNLEPDTGTQMMLFAAFSAIVNAGRKWLTDTTKKED